MAEFPPKDALTPSPQHAAALTALAPGDAPLLIVRRRDGDRTASRMFVQQTAIVGFNVDFGVSLKSKIFYANEGLKSYGLDKFIKYEIRSLDFPLEPEPMHLRDVPDTLRQNRSAVVVLTRPGLQAIYPRIVDLDLIILRGPPIQVEFGLAKDRKDTAESFSIAGVSARMDEAAVSGALAATFAPAEISRDADKGVIRVARGQCDLSDMRGAGVPAEAGAYVRVAILNSWLPLPSPSIRSTCRR